jgi:hypothetical protein
MSHSSLSDKIHSVSPVVETEHDRIAQLDELKMDLAAIVADTRRIVASRLAQADLGARAAATSGAVIARDTIRSHPIASITVAAIIGAGIAVALTPAAKKRSSWATWAPAALSPAHLQEMLSDGQRSVAQSSAVASIGSRLERMLDSISSIDPNASLTPAIEKAGVWLNSMRNALTKN